MELKLPREGAAFWFVTESYFVSYLNLNFGIFFFSVFVIDSVFGPVSLMCELLYFVPNQI